MMYVTGLKTKADIKESVFLMQDVLNTFRKSWTNYLNIYACKYLWNKPFLF